MANLIWFATCFFVVVLSFGHKATSESRFPLTSRASKTPMTCKIRWLKPMEVQYRDNCEFRFPENEENEENEISANSGLTLYQCMEKCKSIPHCTHFTHIDSGSKMCSLINAKMIPMTKNPKSSCGFFPGRISSKNPMIGQIRWPQPMAHLSSSSVEVQYHDTCDFPGKYIWFASGLTFSDCMDRCKNYPGCTHFTFFHSGSQKCYLKSAKIIPMTTNTKSRCGFFPGRSSQKCPSKRSWM